VQVWGDVQAGPMPHWHCPLTLQVLAVDALHATQPAPIAPHWLKVEGTQAAPAQQPVVQEVGSQMHWPPEHRCPAPHGPLVPQRQAPVVQRSVRFASQATQAEPLAPQADSVAGVVQVRPAQQPPGHEVPSHTQLVPLQR
jgi:hypothetical protein